MSFYRSIIWRSPQKEQQDFTSRGEDDSRASRSPRWQLKQVETTGHSRDDESMTERGRRVPGPTVWFITLLVSRCRQEFGIGGSNSATGGSPGITRSLWALLRVASATSSGKIEHLAGLRRRAMQRRRKNETLSQAESGFPCPGRFGAQGPWAVVGCKRGVQELRRSQALRYNLTRGWRGNAAGMISVIKELPCDATWQ
ncbi:hypothetical protein BDW62DRAFT_53874 [Aspergillus aurantiobrunneus]